MLASRWRAHRIRNGKRRAVRVRCARGAGAAALRVSSHALDDTGDRSGMVSSVARRCGCCLHTARYAMGGVCHVAQGNNERSGGVTECTLTRVSVLFLQTVCNQ